jgi:hypothetical protein
MTFSHKSRAYLVVSHPSQRLKSIIQNEFWLRVVGDPFLWRAWGSGETALAMAPAASGNVGRWRATTFPDIS